MEAELDSVSINIEDEMRQSYMDYAMSVIIGRALPDVRDGLKPVQRRILFAMFGEGLLSNRKTSKCAGVVGEVLKRLHPHGDSSVYDALVRLAQPWNMRYPLVDGQGNFGSIDGDPPAAYRYTECRMTSLAERLLEDIEKETVDFTPNFDDSSNEPLVLPSLWPNLLVNGSDGIAVGMATHIPPHNLTEVIQATIALIKNPELGILELMEYIPGPDFPTGGTIMGLSGIKKAYATGRGILRISARTHFETLKRKSREVEAIIVTELPYQVNKARLQEKIVNLVQEKSIDGISNIRDESDRKGIRVVVELKRDATPEVVLNQLYKMTPLQTSYGITSLAIVEGKPQVCSLKELLNNFVDHRRDVVTRKTQFLLGKAKDRMHLLEGFRVALLNLDEVIQLIKGSETPAIAREALCARYELSEIQSQAILDLRLQKLTGMERMAIEKEWEELAQEIQRLELILADTTRVDKIIVEELEVIREKYGDERRTQIDEVDIEDFDAEDLIEDEEMVVTLSHQGYIKRTAIAEYREQKRGGRGVAGAASKGDDFVEHLFAATNHQYLLILTSLGRMHWLKVYRVPESGRTGRGRALVNLLELHENESITAVLPVREFKEDRYLAMCTAMGYVKRTSLDNFSRPRKAGLIACSLDEGDRLIGVGICSGEDDLLISSSSGMAIRFRVADVRTMGRSARGVRGIRLEGTDTAVGMAVVSAFANGELNEEENRALAHETLFTVCEHGYGKRTSLDQYRAQGRGGKGLIDIKTTERNGAVIGVCPVSEESGLMIITSGGKIIRFSAGDISVIGRNTQGVRIINLDEGERVVAVAHLAEEETEEETVS